MSTNLILLSGEGKRFKKGGYKLPKPLIEVSGKPMVLLAAASAPRSDNWVFIVRQEHIDNFGIDQVLKREFPNCKIKAVNETTEGQAATALLAADLIVMDEPLFIGACDNGMVWSKNKYQQLVDQFEKDPSLAMVVWTFSEMPSLATNPTAWGWVDLNKNQVIKRMSVKVPISDDPYHDQAVIGAFTFRDGNTFKKIVDRLIKDDIRVNNEYYLDSCPDVVKTIGMKSLAFKVDQYIGWGTPEDLKTYEYWQNYFDKAEHHPYRKSLDPDFK